MPGNEDLVPEDNHWERKRAGDATSQYGCPEPLASLSSVIGRKTIAMHYQLTLQFRGDSLDDYDAMIALEDELAEELGDSADVDGHDAGSGETNIFIFTSDPAATFQRVKPVLERAQRLQPETPEAALCEVPVGVVLPLPRVAEMHPPERSNGLLGPISARNFHVCVDISPRNSI